MNEQMKTIPPHPSRGLAMLSIFSGVVLGGITLSSQAGAEPLRLLLGLMLVGFGFWLWRSGNAVQLVNTALGSAARGEKAEAAALLVRAQKDYGRLVGRNAGLQQALLSWTQPDIEATRMHLNRVIEGTGSRWNARVWIDAAYGLRALSEAVGGDEERASKDISTTRERKPSRPEPLAYAALAEALLLDAKGDLPTLRSHLATNCWLLFGHLPARERVLARALWLAAYRDTGAGAPSVPAERASDPADSEEAWVRTLVPRLAPWLVVPERKKTDGERRSERADGPRRSQTKTRAEAGGARAPTDATKVEPPARGIGTIVVMRGAALAAGLILIIASAKFLRAPKHEQATESASSANSQVATASAPAAANGAPVPIVQGPASLSPAVSSSTDSDESRRSLYLYALVIAAFAGVVGRLIWSARSQQKRISAARLLLASGDLEGAQEQLSALTSVRAPAVIATVHYELALIADRRADFESSLALCSRGLSLIAARKARVSMTDRLRAELVAARTHAQVLLGEDAKTLDLEKVANSARASACQRDILMRAQILESARRGDWQSARNAAFPYRPAEGVDPRTHVLAEAASALASGDRPRLQLLRALLGDWHTGARWLERAAPKLHAELKPAR